MCHKCTALGRCVAALHGNSPLPVERFDFPFPAVGCVRRAPALLGLMSLGRLGPAPCSRSSRQQRRVLLAPEPLR
jgi:hypothetical protein